MTERRSKNTHGNGSTPVIDTPQMLLTREELMQLREWNATATEYPRDLCLHQLFEAQVERTPERAAVSFEGSMLTYRELNRRANQLAHYLRRTGVGPDTLVGLFMDRSLEMVIGIYAILKAGGAYVPLSPEYPPAFIEHMLEDTGVAKVLTRQCLEGMLPTNNLAEVLCLDSDWSGIAGEKGDNPVCGATPGNLAYVIYTSGSTGRPKGVMNEHRGIVNRLLWMQDEYRLGESDTVLQKSPFTFDVSVWEFFWPLLCGARLVMARPGGHRDTAYLVDTIIREEITTVHFVPSMLRAFLEEERAAQCCGVKHVFSSGEALSYSQQMDFFNKMEASELHNLYGPAEAAVDVTYWRCRRDGEPKVVPIGRPVANTQVYILDERMQPLPVSVPGELHIGGVQVARGYLNRPELTAEKFVPDPFSGHSGARLYKTGDICRFLADGSIEYLGRNDFQVKIRGQRIETGEIEAVLAQHPAVRQSLIMAREDTPGDRVLVGYVVPAMDKTITVSMLRGYLKERVPEFMVPAAFVILKEFPLTPNGKADRRALPAPNGLRPELDSPYVPPRTELERMIAAIWQSVLSLEITGMNDNFFDLGGDSLRMIQVHDTLREIVKQELTILDMFEYPTISSLAEYLSAGRADGHASLNGEIGDRTANQTKEKARLKRLGNRSERPGRGGAR